MRRTFTALCVTLLLLVLPVTVLAAEKPLVIDNAGLMSRQQADELIENLHSFRTQYEMDVVILTVDTLNGKQPQAYADDYFDYNSYGYGEEYSGILFLLSMEERDWYVSTHGEATKYDILASAEEVISYFINGEYYIGFHTWLNILPAYFEPESPSILLSLIIGLVAAGISILLMRFSMNSKRPQRSAENYMVDGSYHLRTHQDIFLYSNITKTIRPKQTSSGGGSVHRSSSGRRHGGGGGKF